MNRRSFQRVWGEAFAFFYRRRRFGLADAAVVIATVGTLAALVGVAREWHGQLRPAVEIDTSPWALPRYTLYSLSRGLLAYVISLAFTLIYGYWAAKDRLAERVLVPLLDVLQSIPVLGFMPGLVLALVGLFPHTNTGLELAAVLMIFTGQAWNMTFSYYNSLKSVPPEQREAADIYHFSWWGRLHWVELPYATMGLVWNSMMSMAGGWFFLMINEAFVLGDRDFRLPGLGSYMSVAVARGDAPAMVRAVIAMMLMIIVLDQLLWRPVVVWAQKFRIEEGGAQPVMTSWVLQVLRRSGLLRWLSTALHALEARLPELHRPPQHEERVARPGAASGVVSVALFAALVGGLAVGGWKLVELVRVLPAAAWLRTLGAACATLGRVLVATALGTLWTVPLGLAIGLNPRLSRVLQPIVQIVASFPAPMLFPAVIALLSALHVTLGWGSIALMLLGTQWYILFNVVGGAMAIPADLREAARAYRLSSWQRMWSLYLPAILPYLVTGWVTAAGGAWNASIVSEYAVSHGEVLTAWGVGSQISLAAQHGDFHLLAMSIVVMSAMVVAFNRVVWRRLYRIAASRFSLAR